MKLGIELDKSRFDKIKIQYNYYRKIEELERMLKKDILHYEVNGFKTYGDFEQLEGLEREQMIITVKHNDIIRDALIKILEDYKNLLNETFNENLNKK